MSGDYSQIALIAVSTAVQAAGSIQQANAAKAASNFNADVSRRNAQLARQQGAADAAAFERETRIRQGAARAKVGGTGVAASSFDDLFADSARQAEMDRLSILYNADMQAAGGELSAGLEEMSGDQARTAGLFSASGSLLKGGVAANQADGSLFTNMFSSGGSA